MQNRLVIVMCCVAALAGCDSRKLPPEEPLRQSVWPTSDRPIVPLEYIRGGGLLFGGPQGDLRTRMEFGTETIRGAISPNGRRAATISYDRLRTHARWVTFFDESGQVLAHVMLPAAPPSEHFLMVCGLEISVSNAPEALVTIIRSDGRSYLMSDAMRSLPGRCEASVERFHVTPSGAVQAVAAKPAEQIRPLFPKSGGIVLLRTSGEPHLVRPWQVERYDEGFRLRWSKSVEAHWLWLSTAKYDFSLRKQMHGATEILHFRDDGTVETETVPPPQ